MRRGWIAIVSVLVLATAGWFVSRRSSVPDTDPLTVAWSAVHEAPRRPAGWVHLGETQAALGQVEAAEHSYRTALRLGDGSGLAYARLGFVLYERGADAEARVMLVEARRRGASVPLLDETIAQLGPRDVEPPSEPAVKRSTADGGVRVRAEPSLHPPTHVELDASVAPEIVTTVEPKPELEPEPEPEPEVLGPCEIELTKAPRGRVFIIPIVIDGHEAELILDTGASITVLTDDFASRIRLPHDPHRRMRAITANGSIETPTGVVERVELGERILAGGRVAICDNCVGQIADGLLGLDLVAAFGLELDVTRAVARFSDCDR